MEFAHNNAGSNGAATRMFALEDHRMKLSSAARCVLFSTLFCITIGSHIAVADDVAIANYGVAMNGMPFAIAISKGYFKDEGAPNITGIMTDSGGGTTIRNLTAGDLLYGESSLAAVVSAIQSGADIKIISEDASLVTDICFVTLPNSPIKSINDIK